MAEAANTRSARSHDTTNYQCVCRPPNFIACALLADTYYDVTAYGRCRYIPLFPRGKRGAGLSRPSQAFISLGLPGGWYGKRFPFSYGGMVGWVGGKPFG